MREPEMVGEEGGWIMVDRDLETNLRRAVVHSTVVVTGASSGIGQAAARSWVRPEPRPYWWPGEGPS